MEEKKHVLFVVQSMGIGGTEKSLLSLIDTLKNDYEVTVLLLEKKGGFLDAVPDWVKVEEIADYAKIEKYLTLSPSVLIKQALKKGRLVESIKLLFNHFRFRLTKNRLAHYTFVVNKMERLNTKYDIAVAYYGPHDFISTYVLKNIDADKKIQWIHFDVKKHPCNHRFMQKVYPCFDRVYAVSKESTQHLIEAVPAITNKAFVKYNVVSAERCLDAANHVVSYTDGFAGIRILTVGRLGEEKGQDIIPDVVRSLKEQGHHVRWYLIGEGPLREEIERKCKRWNIAEDVVLLGAKANPYPFYRDCDLYVQTSHHEGYCLTLAEAKAFQLPIVSTDFSGAHEQLDGTENLIVSRDKDALTNAIASLIKNK